MISELLRNDLMCSQQRDAGLPLSPALSLSLMASASITVNALGQSAAPTTPLLVRSPQTQRKSGVPPVVSLPPPLSAEGRWLWVLSELLPSRLPRTLPL